MDRDPTRSLEFYQNKSRALEKGWQDLCARHLPLAPQDSIWRYYRARRRYALTRGWKLHLSATVLNAGRVLERVAPFLAERDVQFKAPCSLRELIRINSGLYYGYSQVGKIITVYPRSTEEAVELAQLLHRMTRRMAGPSVPFDLKYGSSGSIYYRFGAFKHLEIKHANGKRTWAMLDPTGKLVPDERESETARPDWVTDPFEELRARSRKQESRSPLAKRFRVFRALAQRGKGGVYQAIDLEARPPRLCLLKEGRKNGEVAWDGRDGFSRVQNEERVLSALRASSVDVPRVYSSFELESNFYLVTEFVEGESLHNLLRRLKRRLPVSRVLHYGIQLANFFAQIHRAGWLWRDCKPLNIVVTPGGHLRPLDFEGACLIARPDPMLWGTPGFTPPGWRDLNRQTGIPDDLYALGSTLYLLLTGRVPEDVNSPVVEKLRRNVPLEMRSLVGGLLSADPQERPAATTVLRELKKILFRRDGHSC